MRNLSMIGVALLLCLGIFGAGWGGARLADALAPDTGTAEPLALLTPSPPPLLASRAAAPDTRALLAAEEDWLR